MEFSRNEDKNWAIAYREGDMGIRFEDVVEAIEDWNLLDIVSNPKKKYPHQYIIIVNIHKYAYEVPCRKTEKWFHLITAYPSRKASAFYNLT